MFERHYYPSGGNPSTRRYTTITEAHIRVMEDMQSTGDPYCGIRSILALLDLEKAGLDKKLVKRFEVAIPYGAVVWTYLPMREKSKDKR